MALAFYNTLSKKVEPFVSIKECTVGLYTCGPTVYNYAHIGNFRAYILGDIAKRSLLYCGYEVNHIMNLTDVDDKTIRDSQKEGKTLEEFTTFYTNAFKNDLGLLNIVPPITYARAVEHIPEMIELVEKLIEKGYAYSSDDGSVYFDIHKDTEYGQLSNIAVSEKLENAGGRIKLDEYEKENADDFALWKAWDASDGDVFWEPEKLMGRTSKLGKGRPGWHIECSAMSMRYLGEHFDMHTGGVDLVFPHHENEIAQSECATGKKFVNYWLHNEWVMVDGKKMAKSMGNFITLRTITEKDINPVAFRLWTLMGHYRTRINFTWEALEGCEMALKRLYMLYAELPDGGAASAAHQKHFRECIENDMDTSRALASLWAVLKDDTLTPADRKATLADFDRVLGLGLTTLTKEEIPSEIIALAQEREGARKEKNWARSDELRTQIESKGYSVKDTDSGFKLTSTK